MGPKPPVLTPPNKNIRVIREIRVQEPCASRNNKAIRVIRAIRVQKPYASRINKEYPRPQKNNPWSSHLTSKFKIIHVLS